MLQRRTGLSTVMEVGKAAAAAASASGAGGGGSNCLHLPTSPTSRRLSDQGGALGTAAMFSQYRCPPSGGGQTPSVLLVQQNSAPSSSDVSPSSTDVRALQVGRSTNSVKEVYKAKLCVTWGHERNVVVKNRYSNGLLNSTKD